MSTLSNVDIEKELIQGNILIYPFKRDNIKGASYNFTVGQFAYRIPDNPNDAKSSYESVYDSVNKRIVLPPKSTVLVATNESIWVSPKIAGTYHSKVKLVSKGIGHIGTTLDPGYLGVALVALHNLSESEVPLQVEEETFVSITFHYLKTQATVEHDNDPGRPDLVAMIAPNEEDRKWLEIHYRRNKNELKKALNEDSDFEKFKKSYSEKWRRVLDYMPYIICLILIALGVYLSNFSSNKRIDFFADKLTTGALAVVIVQIFSDMRRRD
ncbi:MAG: deoxycytidine triphosphate deaminase [Cyanobacteria bacterium]|jgi:deoxycytidine triphosphate deaminase|nr:deoxycytidine triphosphate deaminase [Cyanobacteria bacterium GSL.Bin1]